MPAAAAGSSKNSIQIKSEVSKISMVDGRRRSITAHGGGVGEGRHDDDIYFPRGAGGVRVANCLIFEPGVGVGCRRRASRPSVASAVGCRGSLGWNDLVREVDRRFGC